MSPPTAGESLCKNTPIAVEQSSTRICGPCQRTRSHIVAPLKLLELQRARTVELPPCLMHEKPQEGDTENQTQPPSSPSMAGPKEQTYATERQHCQEKKMEKRSHAVDCSMFAAYTEPFLKGKAFDK